MSIDGTVESLDKIFSAIMVGNIRRDNPHFAEKQDVFRRCMSKFIQTFKYNIFEDEYAIMYEAITTMKVKVFTSTQMEILIKNNANHVLTSGLIKNGDIKYIIDDAKYTDEEKIMYIIETLKQKISELSNNVVTEEEFDSACELYISMYKDHIIRETANNMALIMDSDGIMLRNPSGRNTLYCGADAAQKYYNERQTILRSFATVDRIRHTIINNEYFEEEQQKESTGETEDLMDFGIEEIDDKVGKLRRSNMIAVLGPPKGGKTRMSAYLAERALSQGLNVCVWPLEGTQTEWNSMIIALMARKLPTGALRISSKSVLQRKYKEEAERQTVQSLKKILSSPGAGSGRGTLSFISGTAYVEDFIEVLEGHYNNENRFDIIIIDQLINLMSKTGKGKTERISEGYMELKNLIANQLPIKPVAILPTQLKQDVVDLLRRNPDETIDVTAGGESAETVRSPDEVIGLFSSKQERRNNQMRIYSVASRHGENFEDFSVGCELGCCYFYSNPDLNT